MGKEEIAHNEQFLLFPQCFLTNQKIVSQFIKFFCIISLFTVELEEPIIGISGKGLRMFLEKKKGMLTHTHTMTSVDVSGKEAFSKHRGKRIKC